MQFQCKAHEEEFRKMQFRCRACEDMGWDYARNMRCFCFPSALQRPQTARVRLRPGLPSQQRQPVAEEKRQPLVRAQSSETAWYAPLDRALSWDPVNQRQQKLESKRPVRGTTPPPRVDPVLLRQRIPSPTELSALDDARRRAAEEKASWEQEKKVVARASRNGSDDQPLSSYDSLQKAFLDQHGDDILKEMGPGVTLEPAPIAGHLQNRVLTAAQKSGSVPNFGYHGTAQQNYGSIFSQGLRIPGNGGVSVAHGSAHGVGIYTAKGGNAHLSKGFVPYGERDLLVVGVVDKPQKKAPSASPRIVDGHRQHRKPDPGSAPQYIGGRKVQSDDGGVRVVGGARVIFDEERVMPLLVARGGGARGGADPAPLQAPSQLQQVAPLNQKVTDAPVQRAGTDQVVLVESGETVWAPPEAYDSRFAINVKRRVVARERDVHRARQRDVKAWEMAGVG